MEAWYALYALIVAVAPLLLAWLLLARRDRSLPRSRGHGCVGCDKMNRDERRATPRP